MPLPDLSPEQRKAALESASADLRYLLVREEVLEVHQGKLFRTGVTTLGRFAALVGTEAELKELATAELGIDSAADLLQRVQASALVCAWQSARSRVDQRAKLEGEFDARQITKPLPSTDHEATWKALKQRWGPPEESEVPAV